jgi:multidrug efflux pump subunit AcrA (membrane-fusion protein)
MAECLEVQAEAAALANLLARLEAADRARESFVDIPELPDLDSLLAAQKKLNSYAQVLRSVAASQKAAQQFLQQSQDNTTLIAETEEQLHKLLIDAGKCPTCNQDIVK